MLRRHLGLVVLLLVGAALRVAALVAIQPGTFFSDTNEYVQSAATGTLSTIRPDGYSFVVAPFYALGSAQALIVLQHVVGLGLAVAVYALLLRRGAPRWLALLGAAPLALDLYLVVVEHTIMAETVFHTALIATLALVMWWERPGPAALAAAGLLLGYVAIVRSVGVPVLAVFVVYLLVRRVGWRGVVAFAIGWAVVVGGYMTVYHHQHGDFAVSSSSGRFLYGKVAPFADCAKLDGLPAGERRYCPDTSDRLTPNGYTWSRRSPIYGNGPEDQAAIRGFALRVVRADPGRYASIVFGGVLHYFEAGHRIGPDDYSVEPWRFPADPRVIVYPGFRGPIRDGTSERRRKDPIIEPNRYVGEMVGTSRVVPGVSSFLRDLQLRVFTPGPLLAVCLLLVLAALLLRRGTLRLRADAALLAATALGAVLLSQALSVFSYRYGMTLIVLLPPAAALAVTALRAGRGTGSGPAAG